MNLEEFLKYTIQIICPIETVCNENTHTCDKYSVKHIETEKNKVPPLLSQHFLDACVKDGLVPFLVKSSVHQSGTDLLICLLNMKLQPEEVSLAWHKD